MQTLEHIIPNSIGGVLKSNKLICCDCNSDFGSTIDSELAASYESIVSLLGLKRDRPRDFTIKNLQDSKGERYHLIDGKIPTPAKPEIKIEGNKIAIVARDKKQLRQILNGQSRKYPGLKDLDLGSVQLAKNQYLKDKLNIPLTIGGDGVFRSVGKMALNLFVHEQGYATYLDGLIAVVTGHQPNDDHVHHCHMVDTLKLEDNEVFHFIYIHGDPRSGLLFAYVVIFSANAFIVNLSESYTGPVIGLKYGYEVLTNKVIHKDLQVNYPGRIVFKAEKSQNKDLFHQKNIQSIQYHFNRLMQIVDARHTEYAQDKILRESMEEVLAKHGRPETMTKAVIDDYINTVSYRLAVFIDHINNRSINNSSDDQD